MIKNFLIILITTCLFFITAEYLLPLFWQNPFSDSSSASYVELRQQRSNINKIINRAWLDPNVSEVSFKTDDRGYMPLLV